MKLTKDKTVKLSFSMPRRHIGGVEMCMYTFWTLAPDGSEC